MKPSLASQSIIGNNGNIGEISQDTERREGARLELARKTVLEELEALRSKLIGLEQEQNAFKRTLGLL